MKFRTIENMSSLIRENITLFHDYDLIVGIPRSGMLPASVIALYLNKPLATVNDWLINAETQSGITRKTNQSFTQLHHAKKVLIVDDSVNTGISLLKLKENIPEEFINKATFLAIYSSSNGNVGFDFSLENVGRPRIFEWNVFHTSLCNSTLYDIDGVLCEDPNESDNDDGSRYLKFLKEAKPLFIPSQKVLGLVTNRLSKYESQTHEWMKNNGVDYDKLFLAPYNSKLERQKNGDYTSHKANVYKNSNANLFIESDEYQAIGIAKKTGKYVYCVGNNKLYGPSSIVDIASSPSSYVYHLKNALKKIPFLIESYRYLRRVIK